MIAIGSSADNDFHRAADVLVPYTIKTHANRAMAKVRARDRAQMGLTGVSGQGSSTGDPLLRTQYCRSIPRTTPGRGVLASIDAQRCADAPVSPLVSGAPCPSFLAAIGRFSARHRWAVILAWVVIFGVLAVVALGGINLNAKATAATTPPHEGAAQCRRSSGDVLGCWVCEDAAAGPPAARRGQRRPTPPSTTASRTCSQTRKRCLHCVDRLRPLRCDSTLRVEGRHDRGVHDTFSGLTKANQENVYEHVLHFAADQRGEFRAESAASCSPPP